MKATKGLTIQSLRFPKSDGWTLEKAKEWVKEHSDIHKVYDSWRSKATINIAMREQVDDESYEFVIECIDKEDFIQYIKSTVCPELYIDALVKPEVLETSGEQPEEQIAMSQRSDVIAEAPATQGLRFTLRKDSKPESVFRLKMKGS